MRLPCVDLICYSHQLLTTCRLLWAKQILLLVLARYQLDQAGTGHGVRLDWFKK
ncbi:MAG: hypothetical protein V7629_03815 [Motiliproteus sp.]